MTLLLSSYLAGELLAGSLPDSLHLPSRTSLKRQIELGAVDGRAGRSSELFAEFLRRHGLPPAGEGEN